MSSTRMVSGMARFLVAVMVMVLIVAGLGAASYYTYQAGYARGVLENATFVTPDGAPAEALPYFYYGRPFFHPGVVWGPAGLVGGFLQCLIPLLILFLFFGLLRMLFWRGPWRRVWHGAHHWEGGPPPHVEEWHRRAHGEAPGEAKPHG